MKKVISTVICIVLALLMALSIFMIVRHYSEEKQAADTYSDMQDFVVTEGADDDRTIHIRIMHSEDYRQGRMVQVSRDANV